MKKFYIAQNETGFCQGEKNLVISKATRWPLLLFLLMLIAGGAYAQAPTLSYPGPKTFEEGQPVSLAPTSSGVGSLGYNVTGTAYGSGYNTPYGVATDASGNLYVADYHNGIIKIPPGNGAPVSIGAGLSQLNYPYAVAADMSGNLYIAVSQPEYGEFGGYNGYADNYVWKLPVGSNTPVMVDFDIFESDGGVAYTPFCLAMDGTGDLFIAHFTGYGQYADPPAMYNIEELPVGSSTTQVIYSNYWNVIAMAGDAAGDLFLSNYAGGVNHPTYVAGIRELPSGSTTPASIPGSYPSALAICIDAAGDLYAVDGQTGNLTMTPAGKPYGPQVTIGTNISYATGLAVDRLNNVYISNYNYLSPPGSVSQVKPTGGYFINPQLPAGLSFNNNTGVINGRATAVSPSTTYTVTAYNNSGSASATVSFKVTQGSGNAYLTHLIPTRGAFSPQFSAFTMNYTATVANGVRSFQLTPISASPFAYVNINGMAVADSAISAPIPLAVGADTIRTVVTAPDNVTTKTYTLIVNRPGNSIDNLLSVTLSSGALSPPFAASTTHYTASVANTVRSITITPTAQDPDETIKVNGKTVASGNASAAIALGVGDNIISIAVTSSDNAATKTYTITVNRASSNNDNLSYLNISNSNLSPAFAPATTTYTTEVGNAESTVNAYVTAQDPDATITVNGTVQTGFASPPVNLSVGPNTINIVVTASDRTTTQTYAVTITRDPSTNANLSALTLSSGTLLPGPFSPTTYTYTTNVGYEDSLFTVTPTTAVNGATVKVNGLSVASGSASGPIALAAGSNTVTIVVTGATGTTTKTYNLTVTRAASVNADLYALQINYAGLSPAFSPGTLNYTDNVVNTATTVKVTPTASDPHSAITVNGTVVASGSATAPIHLIVGSNTLSVVVTAPGGAMTKTYTLTITRAASGANIPDASLSVDQQQVSPPIEDDVIVVRQGISPNGDGINDFLVIDGILAYPDNKLSISNRNGALVYEAKGYDNSLKVFDGHSSKTGQMQLPGTYFYSLEYTVKGLIKRKTGYLVLKY